ncbi:MAG: hypothetical protein Q4Q53_00880 [Methanocorpusculum sp.]|nr:hypothetical protein [Methanocorpusculum sp.]
MHYALVSDLMSKEEFDKRVEDKVESLGGVIDETTAAMIVVDELGRSHIKIGDIPQAQTQIVSFFGKVLEVSEPREFSRGENEEDKGIVSHIVLGDPTGTVKLTLWDSLAGAVAELPLGSVVEAIAKPRFGKKEATCAALRESCVEIVETKTPPKSEIMASPLEVKILAAFPAREITRRDGGTSSLQEFIVGDESGAAKLVTWSPETFADVDEGSCVSIDGVNRKEEEGTVEYVALDSAVITPLAKKIEVLSQSVDEVCEGHTSVVFGKIVSVSETRKFITRRGTESQVKNLKISGENKTVNAALWGENADALFLAGDEVEVINAEAKLNRYGEVELSVGRGSAVRVRETEGEEVTVRGLIIERPEGLSVDDGKNAWILVYGEETDAGIYAEVSGVCRSGRIYADRVARIELNAEKILGMFGEIQ